MYVCTVATTYIRTYVRMYIIRHSCLLRWHASVGRWLLFGWLSSWFPRLFVTVINGRCSRTVIRGKRGRGISRKGLLRLVQFYKSKANIFQRRWSCSDHWIVNENTIEWTFTDGTVLSGISTKKINEKVSPCEKKNFQCYDRFVS